MGHTTVIFFEWSDLLLLSWLLSTEEDAGLMNAHTCLVIHQVNLAPGSWTTLPRLSSRVKAKVLWAEKWKEVFPAAFPNTHSL